VCFPQKTGLFLEEDHRKGNHQRYAAAALFFSFYIESQVKFCALDFTCCLLNSEKQQREWKKQQKWQNKEMI